MVETVGLKKKGGLEEATVGLKKMKTGGLN
jgi:hypothetical protein